MKATTVFILFFLSFLIKVRQQIYKKGNWGGGNPQVTPDQPAEQKVTLNTNTSLLTLNTHLTNTM